MLEKLTEAKIHQRDRQSSKKYKRKTNYSSIESDDSSVELTKEQVKAALTSLIPIDRQIQAAASHKRHRNRSFDHTLENPSKKHKPVYHDVIPSNINQPETMVLATSGLNHHQMKQIKKFVLLFNCRLLILDDKSTFNHAVTHVITDEIGPNDSLTCTLTKTVIFAIAQHCFVLSYRWIGECLKQNSIVAEEQYEIEGDHMIATKHNGPRRSRLSQRPLLPLNHFVMIKGDGRHFLELTNTELGDLAWLAGGIYIEQNRFPNTVFPRQCFLLIEDEDIRNKNMFHRCIDKGLKFLRSEWLVRSIVEHRMADIVQYHCDPFDTIDRSE